MKKEWEIILQEQRDGYCYCVIEKKDATPCRVARRGATLDESLNNCYQTIKEKI